jgi:signal transduction histidine kinase
MLLRVKANPIKIENRKFILIFLQDITKDQQRAALERTFFHDFNNMLTMLIGSSELLTMKAPSDLGNQILKTSLRLKKEIEIQQYLAESENPEYEPLKEQINTWDIIEELKNFFTNHPVAHNKNIDFQKAPPSIKFNTDFSLLSRVLCNMTLNALEATEENGCVKIWVENDDNKIIFCVWNAGEIPEKTRLRIFQRNFSTKEAFGRGIGTFSMKLFGEEILGGKVSFDSSAKEGTTFKFYHPL